jgi:hypothetical protein
MSHGVRDATHSDDASRMYGEEKARGASDGKEWHATTRTVGRKAFCGKAFGVVGLSTAGAHRPLAQAGLACIENVKEIRRNG